MTGKRTGSTSKSGAKKMKLKRETLKDLGARDAKRVKGGTLMATGIACHRVGGLTALCVNKKTL